MIPFIVERHFYISAIEPNFMHLEELSIAAAVVMLGILIGSVPNISSLLM
jgi:hypothetical protein